MNHSRLLMAAAFASFLGLPVAVNAQVTNGGSSNYGIFGGGTSQGGSGFGGSSSGQQGFGNAAMGSFGRSSTTAIGSPSISPYLNLTRPGNTAVNYYALVRPQVRQDAINTQVGTTIQQTDRLLNSQQQAIRQDPYAANNDLSTNALPSNYRKPEPAAPAAQRRRGSDDADAGFNDWASGKDLGLTGEVRTAEDARQRAAALRRAKELKALEDELSGNADSTTSATPPARTAAAQPTYPPGFAAPLKPANHYFPQATGTLVNRSSNPAR